MENKQKRQRIQKTPEQSAITGNNPNREKIKIATSVANMIYVPYINLVVSARYDAPIDYNWRTNISPDVDTVQLIMRQTENFIKSVGSKQFYNRMEISNLSMDQKRDLSKQLKDNVKNPIFLSSLAKYIAGYLVEYFARVDDKYKNTKNLAKRFYKAPSAKPKATHKKTSGGIKKVEILREFSDAKQLQHYSSNRSSLAKIRR